MKKKLMITAVITMVLMLSAVMAGCGNDSCSNSSKQDSSASENVSDKVPAFETKDIEGNTVSSDIFADKDITVLNVWGTFCGPCIGEMPELAQWDKELPDNVQILGLVIDVPEDTESDEAMTVMEDAKKIVSEAGVEFTNIVPDSELQKFLSNVSGVPTTFFVNSKGEIIGDPIVGADVKAYMDFVKNNLNN